MTQHPVELLVAQADRAIDQEDFDTLMEIYAEDALLVVRPGRNAVGKKEIRSAFEAIAAHFEHTLQVGQGAMQVLEAEDTALVQAKTLVSAHGQPAVERKATYVFKTAGNGNWRCVIDNSYGHELLESSV